MKAPRFWYDKPGLRAAALSPLSWVFGALAKARQARSVPLTVDVPVICVGNINVGGTGKTPVTIAIADHLRSKDIAVHTVLAGYGGNIDGPIRVDERAHRASDVGDEALLHAAFGPTWVSKDRAAGAKAAVAAGAQTIVLDDGFQNFGLAKDLSFVVVDAKRGWGNGRVLPAGPLREPVDQGLARADAVILVGDQGARAAFAASQTFDLPVLGAELRPLQTGMDWADMRCVAFAGIGDPNKFFATLMNLGAELVATHSLDDHAPLTSPVLTRLVKEAAAKNAQLVCTEKDMVRLPASFRAQVTPLPVRMEFADPSALSGLLTTTLNRSQQAR